MKVLRWILAAGLLILALQLAGCSEEDQEALKRQAVSAAETAAAQVGQDVGTAVVNAKDTALAEGKEKAQTAIPAAKETGVAAAQTEAARLLRRARKVVLDPGHGWQGDPGAVYEGHTEKDVNLAIALATRDALERMGYQVALTRTGDDMEHGLEYAATFANQQKPDLVVSIHANATSNGKASGTESCYTVGKPTDANSQRLAGLLTDAVSSRLGLKKLGDFPENSAHKCARQAERGWTQIYIHDMDSPAALIETGFLSNAQDRDLLVNHPEAFAEAIVAAIENYY